MLLNLSDAFASEGKVETLEAALEMTEFTGPSGAVPIVEKTPVSLKVSNVGKGKARISGSATLVFDTVCDRCLEPVSTKLEVCFDRAARSPELEAEDDEEEDEALVDGYHLDVETLVRDEISVNWPVKILCRTDCKGICPVCGRNLNAGECGCDTFVPDPRMAGIKELFEQMNKEV